MTPRQIDLVQDSVALIVPRLDDVAALFYDRLFELAPQSRAMFKGNLQGQGAKLMQVLTAFVRSLPNLVPVLQILDDLARRHFRYDARNAYYASAARSLILALREALGEAFTIEVEEAWVDALTLLSSRPTFVVNEIALAA